MRTSHRVAQCHRLLNPGSIEPDQQVALAGSRASGEHQAALQGAAVAQERLAKDRQAELLGSPLAAVIRQLAEVAVQDVQEAEEAVELG